MKKALVFFVALAVTLGFAWSANAANTVQVTLTSPTITKTGCEKVGSVTFAFDAGSVLTVGDWWYMDLPTNTFICNPINYLIVGGNAGAVLNNVANPAAAIFGTVAGTDSILKTALAAGNDVLPAAATGPITATVTSAPVVANAAFKTAGSNMAILVQGAANSRRVLLTLLSDLAASAITVSSTYSMDIKILDGLPHNAGPAGAGVNNGNSMIVLDSNANNTYNDGGVATAFDVIRNPQPAPENTLCVNAELMAGDLMYTSFASLNDKFTFTGDAQIAHTGAAAAISLGNCKGVTEGEILMAAQGACTFTYETAVGYCSSDPFFLQPGNRIYVQGSTTFGTSGDMYQMVLNIDTPGVYFTAAAPTSFQGFTLAQNVCAAAVGVGGTAIATAWAIVNEAGSSAGVVPAGITCTVASANRTRELRSTQFTGIHNYDVMELGLPALSYDTSIVGVGTQAVATVHLSKYPCGEIFSASRTLGTFVTTCTPGAGAGTTLILPFLPPFDGSVAGWWGGFVIVNSSTVAGTAVITFMEDGATNGQLGDCATYTTPSIAAGATWNAGTGSSLLTMVTPCAGNTGTFGDQNVSATAVCTFPMGSGMAFTGNGIEGVGYMAASTEGSGLN